MSTNPFTKRRQELAERIGNGVVVVPADKVIPRNNGNEYPYHQRPNFFYLTGFYEPDAVLVMSVRDSKSTSTIFVQPKDLKIEQWTGIRLGCEKAPQVLDMDAAYNSSELAQKLPEIFKGHKKLYLELFEDHYINAKIFRLLKDYGRIKNADDFFPQQVENLGFILGQMRMYKDADEIESMKMAVEASRKGYEAIMKDPGTNEKDIYATLEYYFNKGGNGAAYTSIVASGNSANIMHYVENDAPLKDGELVLIDAGAEYKGVACDITRTFPNNGKFTEPQKKVYQIVLDSIKAGFDSIAPGKHLDDVHNACVKVLVDGLLELGILEGTPQENIEKKTYRRYFPCATCHWLGLNVHDRCANVDDDGNRLTFAPGMIFTVEPGLYFMKEFEEVPEQYRGIGVRLEDDILITEDGYENLTKCVPKELAEVEAACRR